MASAAECPVIKAWGSSEIILKRLLEKDLIIMSSGKLNRQTVLVNSELLEPIINLVGNLSFQ